MAWAKAHAIAKHFGSPFHELLGKWYLQDQLSGEVIAERISSEVGISITSRSIYLHLKKLGCVRTKSAARNLAIVTGRMNYAPLRKPIKSRELRKGLSLKVRFSIFARDNFRCVLCGADASTTLLAIDHLTPVVRGGTNEPENLRTLCRECNLGKMIHGHEK